MVWSPAIHVFSHENVETVMKKPGATNTLSRKPFVDRSVNACSPAVNKSLKPDHTLKKSVSKLATKSATPRPDDEDEDLFCYHRYSFKTFEDDYQPIQRLSQKHHQKVLRSYCHVGSKTPLKLSPEPDTWDLFVEMPEIDYKFEEDFGEKLLQTSVEDISLPEIEF